MQPLSRRAMIVSGLAAPAAFAQTPPPPPPLPQLKPEIVREFVGKSHADLASVRALAKSEPMLILASWDQGAGDWETGLGAASHMGRRDIAHFLIDSGARVDAFAVFMLGEMGPAKALLAAWPAIHKVSGPHGISLLSHTIAGKKQSWDAFAMLLAAGADVNAAAFRGMTPLMQAAAVSEPDMVRALLDKGADASARTPQGRSALDMARDRKDAAIIEMLTRASGTPTV